MDSQTLKALGYDEIIERLIRLARMPEARRRLACPVFPEMGGLSLLHDETEAALVAGRSLGWPQFPDTDILGIVALALPLDACLAPEELLQVAVWCRQLAPIVTWRETARTCQTGPSILDPDFARVQPPPGLAEAIGRAIDSHGEIVDAASSELARIRREMRELAVRASRILQRMLSESRYEDLWQDRIISVRDGRHVVPIKVGMTGRLRGIILDRSASGETLFIEPDAVIAIDNGIKELELAENRELRRILTDLTTRVRDAGHALGAMTETLSGLDCIFARARLADQLGAVRPEFGDTADELNLTSARHPLLACTPVPVDLTVETGHRALVISGPNTGGKTVALKTIGLLVLMAKSGHFIPAAPGSRLRDFNRVFCDIGDDQSIARNLSTYSAHIDKLVAILAEANADSLVLIDEIGAGTDPREGAALGISIIEEFMARGTTVVATTHYGEIKNHAYTTPGIDIASVSFDETTMRPTYRIERGVPGASHAFSIAARLGLPDVILEHARSRVSSEVRLSEEMFRRIEDDLAAARRKKIAAEEEQAAGQIARETYKRQLERLKAERQSIIDATRLEMKDALRRTETEADAILDALRSRHDAPDARETARLKSRLHALAEAVPDGAPSDAGPDDDGTSALLPGDTVLIRRLNKNGKVLAVAPDGKIDVAIGSFKSTLTRADLALIARATASRDTSRRGLRQAATPGMTLDIRGLRALEAEETVRRYLDDAGMAGLEMATIIHGKASGALRECTWGVLAKHPFVMDFAVTRDEGATEVRIAPV